MPKRTLRKRILALRESMKHEEWLSSSRLAQDRLLSLDEYVRAGCIALYVPIRNETDIMTVFEAALAAGKRVLFPVVCGNSLCLRQVASRLSLGHGAYGIPEPAPGGIDHGAEEPDLIVVPGVVFSTHGVRIGFGKGYYDRFLNQPGRTAVLVGMCHDFQLVDGEVPSERHDITMDLIVTNRRIIRCGGNRERMTAPDSHTGGY